MMLAMLELVGGVRIGNGSLVLYGLPRLTMAARPPVKRMIVVLPLIQ